MEPVILKRNYHVIGGIGATSLFVGGIGTVHVATGTTARYENVNISGLGTIATFSSNAVNAVSINASGMVTASKFYGDGSTLTGVSVGVRTAGAVLGYGVTFLDFRGAGVSTAYFNTNVGIATVFFQGGGGGGNETSSLTSAISDVLLFHLFIIGGLNTLESNRDSVLRGIILTFSSSTFDNFNKLSISLFINFPFYRILPY